MFFLNLQDMHIESVFFVKFIKSTSDILSIRYAFLHIFFEFFSKKDLVE